MATTTPRKRGPHVCMRCGAQDVHTRHYADTVDFKGLTFDVDGLVESRCGNCDLRWTTTGQDLDNLARMRAAFAQKRDEVRSRDGLLTGEQIEFALAELGVTKARAATLWGGGPNAFAKYINGEVLQSVAMDRLLRLTLAFGEHAVAFLELGRDAPLRRNAADLFISALPVHESGWAEAEASQIETVESMGTADVPVLVTATA